MRVVLEIPDQLLRRIDALSKQLMTENLPQSQFEWLNSSAKGKDLWYRISVSHEFDHLTTDSINKMIRNAYVEDVGPRQTGRPNINKYRTRILTEALEAYLRPVQTTKKAA